VLKFLSAFKNKSIRRFYIEKHLDQNKELLLGNILDVGGKTSEFYFKQIN